MTLALPPLRDRAGDVPLLAHHFVARFNGLYRLQRRLSPQSIAVLQAAPWPGNVRELENLLHRELLLADTDVIELTRHLPSPTAAACIDARLEPSEFERGFRAAKASWVAEFERKFLRWALVASGGNVSAAARRAGKERRSFRRLLKKHGLDRAQFAS
jgi:two-component system response regulator GlrR